MLTGQLTFLESQVVLVLLRNLGRVGSLQNHLPFFSLASFLSPNNGSGFKSPKYELSTMTRAFCPSMQEAKGSGSLGFQASQEYIVRPFEVNKGHNQRTPVMPKRLLPFSPTACSLEISTYILPGKGKPRFQVGLIHIALFRWL